MTETTAPTYYTTEWEAIEWGIVEPIAAGALTCSPRVDFDIAAIAEALVKAETPEYLDADGEVIGYGNPRYYVEDDAEEFWAVVAEHARDDEEMIAAILADPTEVHEDGLPEGVVLDRWKRSTEVRAIIPAWHVDELGREYYVEATWYNSEWGHQFGNGERVCAETLGEAGDAVELVALICELAEDGRSAADRIVEQMQDRVDALVKNAPVCTYEQTMRSGEPCQGPFLYKEGRRYSVEVWWNVRVLDEDEQREITAVREITGEEYEAYLADLTEDEDED